MTSRQDNGEEVSSEAKNIASLLLICCVLQAFVSVKRICKFLIADEIDEGNVTSFADGKYYIRACKSIFFDTSILYKQQCIKLLIEILPFVLQNTQSP